MKKILIFILFNILSLFLNNSKNSENINLNVDVRYADIYIENSEKFSCYVDGVEIELEKMLANNSIDIKNYSKERIHIDIFISEKESLGIVEINAIDCNTSVKGINCNKLSMKYECGIYSLESCDILNLDIRVKTQVRFEYSLIQNCHIRNSYIEHEKIHIMFIINNFLENIKFYGSTADLRVVNNDFIQYDFRVMHGKIFIELNDEYGYFFDLIGNNIYLDFETISYDDKIVYKNGKKKIKCHSYDGIIDIRRNFN